MGALILAEFAPAEIGLAADDEAAIAHLTYNHGLAKCAAHGF